MITNWNRYYTLTGLVPAHYAAVALHPEMKLDYFQAEWADKPEWIAAAKSETTSLWNDEYKDSTAPLEADRITSSDPEEDVRWRRNKRARLASDISDAFEAFQEHKGEACGIKGGLSYWVQARALGNIHSPDLINMGLAIHSIPAMSAEPERVFSRYVFISLLQYKVRAVTLLY